MNDLSPFRIEQNLLFVQFDFPPPDVLPGHFELFLTSIRSFPLGLMTL